LVFQSVDIERTWWRNASCAINLISTFSLYNQCLWSTNWSVRFWLMEEMYNHYVISLFMVCSRFVVFSCTVICSTNKLPQYNWILWLIWLLMTPLVTSNFSYFKWLYINQMFKLTCFSYSFPLNKHFAFFTVKRAIKEPWSRAKVSSKNV
jgi:hypothetical protein